MKTPRPNLSTLAVAAGVPGATEPAAAPSAPARLLVKVCGMRDAAALAALAALGPDFLGFIFAPKSPRFVGDVLAPELVRALPPTIWKVGVFVNENTENILATAQIGRASCRERV